jgi:hypothetical protein
MMKPASPMLARQAVDGDVADKAAGSGERAMVSD